MAINLACFTGYSNLWKIVLKFKKFNAQILYSDSKCPPVVEQQNAGHMGVC